MEFNNRTIIFIIIGLILICLGVVCVIATGAAGWGFLQRGESEIIQPEHPIVVQPTSPSPQPEPPQLVDPPDPSDEWETIPLPFFDDFTNPDPSWYQENDEVSSIEFANGGLYMYLNEPDYLSFTSVNVYASDVIVEVDAQKIGGPDDNSFGLVCRQHQETYYYFEVASDGYFKIGRFLDDVYTELHPWTEIDMIYPGDAVNHLRVRCIGDTLTFFANGIALAEVHDSAIPDGYVGLVIGTFETPGVEILFDNFSAVEP